MPLESCRVCLRASQLRVFPMVQFAASCFQTVLAAPEDKMEKHERTKARLVTDLALIRSEHSCIKFFPAFKLNHRMYSSTRRTLHSAMSTVS